MTNSLSYTIIYSGVHERGKSGNLSTDSKSSKSIKNKGEHMREKVVMDTFVIKKGRELSYESVGKIKIMRER